MRTIILEIDFIIIIIFNINNNNVKNIHNKNLFDYK